MNSLLFVLVFDVGAGLCVAGLCGMFLHPCVTLPAFISRFTALFFLSGEPRFNGLTSISGLGILFVIAFCISSAHKSFGAYGTPFSFQYIIIVY